MTPTAAAALVKADNERRVKAAAEAVQAALAAHNCDLVAVVVPNVASDGKLELRAVVQIVAK
jgi:hypothetical protein